MELKNINFNKLRSAFLTAISPSISLSLNQLITTRQQKSHKWDKTKLLIETIYRWHHPWFYVVGWRHRRTGRVNPDAKARHSSFKARHFGFKGWCPGFKARRSSCVELAAPEQVALKPECLALKLDTLEWLASWSQMLLLWSRITQKWPGQ